MNRTQLHLTELNDRVVPAAGVGDLIAVAPDAGGLPEVRLLNSSGTQVASFLAYESDFRGGVRVSLGDLTGDGRSDIVTVPGPGGGPLVKVFDGNGGAQIASFFAYDPAFRGGVSIDVGTVGGRQVIVTGQGLGGPPEVRVFDGQTLQQVLGFNAYDAAFAGGVNVAVGDVLGGGATNQQIVTGAGPGGGPHVKVFSGRTGQEFTGFFAYEPTFTGGVSVATGDIAGLGGRDAVITGAGPGGGPRVSVFDARSGQQLATSFAYDPAFTGGVGVGVVRGVGTQTDRLLTAAGPGGGPQVNVFNGVTSADGLVSGVGAGDPAFDSAVGVTPFGTATSFFAAPDTFTGGLGLGTGFGVSDTFAPTFSPFFGTATNGLGTPNFIANGVYFDPFAPTAAAGTAVATPAVGTNVLTTGGTNTLVGGTTTNLGFGSTNNFGVGSTNALGAGSTNTLGVGSTNAFGPFVGTPVTSATPGVLTVPSSGTLINDGFNFFDTFGTYNNLFTPGLGTVVV